jgi:uncharacterized protein YecT (DUF1311 family)
MKTTVFFFLVLCAFVVLSGSAAAAQKQPAKKPSAQKKQPCANAVTQAEMNRCAFDEYQKADAELNRIYPQVMSKLGAEHKEKLKAAQIAWIKFRDAHCECEAAVVEGGSMEPLLRATCLEQTTRDRTKQLLKLAEGFGK